jgi:hypothetical protein
LVGSGFGEFLFIFTLSLALGYVLSILNVPLTQLYEGYFFRHTLPGRLLTLLQIQRWDWIDKRMKDLDDVIDERAGKKDDAEAKEYPWRNVKYWYVYQRYIESQTERSALAAERRNYFPKNEDVIMPTRLGNVFAAFEEYPTRRYGIDAVALWPRLLPALVGSGYAQVVERQKMGFDFFLNLSVLSGIFALEYSALNLYFVAKLNLIVPLLCLFIAWLCYRFSILAAVGFGTTVKVSYDLHRRALRKALGLSEPAQFDQEVSQWEKYSVFAELLDQTRPSEYPIDVNSMFVYTEAKVLTTEPGEESDQHDKH